MSDASSHPALALFTPQVREWFERAFAAPTPAQVQAWPAIASGRHALISAPTGSGKTLAAFLWALDQFVAEPPLRAIELPRPAARGAQGAKESPAAAKPSRRAAKRSVRLVYISPLKALGYDVERNLRAPLRGIGADVRVGVRTGDTPQRERREMLREPPDILITTPESLYLMLTGQAQALFAGTQWVIVDEIHALAQTKRGAHLAVTLERLAERAGRDVQRIGLSATQRPLDEVARFLVGPSRDCAIVDAGVSKPLDLRIHVPVESMVEPDAPLELDAIPGGEATRRSIWPAIYPELLKLVREHRSTLIFVNNRRAAERIALRLNDLAAREHAERDEAAEHDGAEHGGATDVERGEEDERGPAPQRAAPIREIARAHHGSLAREERLVIEDQLKAGVLPCLVATSSLELGIDMGAVDLVIQVESPKSVTRGLQRIGRAGHGVGEVSQGRIFPKFRADLLECAVVAHRMREGLIEQTVVPRNPLDVLAQQVVAIAAAAGEGAGEGDGAGDGEGDVSVDALHELFRRTWTYADLERRQLENVLDMLDGRYPSQEFGELRARIVWDRVNGTIRARSGARALAVVNAGTIPDRGLFSVNLPDGRRVGELDEEMVYEARAGQTFLLGATSWRIEEITRDRVVVSPAPGVPGAVPFWHGDSVGRPRELGAAIGAFARWAVEQEPETLERDYDLDERAARNLLAFLREQQAATRVVPSDRTVIVERFRDEIGDWRLCVLTPFGGRVHAAWALALTARMRDRFGLAADAIYSDDGIIVHLPDADEPPGAELVLVEPDEVEDLVVAELGASALFGARFRENAARSLLIPRAYPGRRTPLWQQRLKSQSLLEVARRYPQFPVILETYRECLRDVLDLPGLIWLLRGLDTRELSLVEVETATASPFASSLLFDYVATYMYEGDTPSAERRAVALALDRELLRELLGQEELRDLIDPDALEQVEDDLQRLSEQLRARDADRLHDVLRQVGDLSGEEAAQRAAEGADVATWLAQLEAQRRAVRVRVGGQERWIAAEEAGLYRDALGAVPAGGLPEAFLADVPDALRELLRRYARSHGPFESGAVRQRLGVDAGAALESLEQSGELVRGELRPLGTQREWCDPEVLRRLRRASLAVLRREIEPVGREALARFAPAWQGVDRQRVAGAGVERLRDVLAPLQGLPLAPELWEHDVLPRRLGAYSPAWLDELCATGELVWVGAGATGRRTGRVALYFRDDAPLLGPPLLVSAAGRELPDGPVQTLVRARLQAGACFFTDLLVENPQLGAEELRDALWDLVWAGEATNDAFAPLRSRRKAASRLATFGPVASRSSAPRSGMPALAGRFRRRPRGTPQLQGRWSLTAGVFAGPGAAAGVDSGARNRAWAELLLERYGIVTRELVRAEGIAGGFAALYPALSALETIGTARRGYFVEGLGGAQFALSGAVERLREPEADEAHAVVLATADPAQLYGGALTWPEGAGRSSPPRADGGGGQTTPPRAETRTAGHNPARRPGGYVVLVGGRPVISVETGGHSLRVHDGRDPSVVDKALGARAAAVREGQVPRLAIEKIDGEPAIASPLERSLIELGFRCGPRRLTLDRGTV
jgi:ATP-dependent Lhr-like helicase